MDVETFAIDQDRAVERHEKHLLHERCDTTLDREFNLAYKEIVSKSHCRRTPRLCR